jgi:hypothetical protein
MYVFAHKQKFISLNPEIVVKIDELLTKVDEEIVKAKKEAKEKSEKDMKPWLKKYQLWKEMQQ